MCYSHIKAREYLALTSQTDNLGFVGLNLVRLCLPLYPNPEPFDRGPWLCERADKWSVQWGTVKCGGLAPLEHIDEQDDFYFVWKGSPYAHVMMTSSIPSAEGETSPDFWRSVCRRFCSSSCQAVWPNVIRLIIVVKCSLFYSRRWSVLSFGCWRPPPLREDAGAIRKRRQATIKWLTSLRLI